jgi:SPX domain protein involved in polyphosphate accumulation
MQLYHQLSTSTPLLLISLHFILSPLILPPVVLQPHQLLHLQKQVKRLPFKDQLGQQGTLETLSEEEANFVKALSDTLNQLNEMFLEKEENSVIRVERLEHELAAATAPEQLNSLYKDFVDFHGEVLLLVHWSILAYTATVKILKKHHKRTGLLVKAPQLGDLLSQPFCSTEVSCGLLTYAYAV